MTIFAYNMPHKVEPVVNPVAAIRGCTMLLARLREVHQSPRYDIDPGLKADDPVAYQLALFEACR